MSGLFASLTDDELLELATRLDIARERALDMKYEGLDDEGHGGFEDPRYVVYSPVYAEVDSVYMLAFNERNARDLGCRWQPCGVCRHESCGFCPTCNPEAIAPNGEAYDDAENAATSTHCT